MYPNHRSPPKWYELFGTFFSAVYAPPTWCLQCILPRGWPNLARWVPVAAPACRGLRDHKESQPLLSPKAQTSARSARFQSVFIRVLHPGVRESQSVEILRGLPEGSRLTPACFWTFCQRSNCISAQKFPRATVSWGGSFLYCMSMTYVCLISAHPWNCRRCFTNDSDGVRGPKCN